MFKKLKKIALSMVAAVAVLFGGAAAQAHDIGPAPRKDVRPMEDGTVFVGPMPDRNDKMQMLYTTPGDAPAKMSHKEATDYCHGLSLHGHQDWLLPDMEELRTLSLNMDYGVLKGTFNNRSWYVSSEHSETFVDTRHMNNGSSGASPIWDNDLSVRCVRVYKLSPSK